MLYSLTSKRGGLLFVIMQSICFVFLNSTHRADFYGNVAWRLLGGTAERLMGKEHITEELWLRQPGMLKKEQSMPERDIHFFWNVHSKTLCISMNFGLPISETSFLIWKSTLWNYEQKLRHCHHPPTRLILVCEALKFYFCLIYWRELD